MAAENKIIIKHEDFTLDEDGEVASTSSGITPGDLVAIDSSDEYDVHDTAGGNMPQVRFARKGGEIGKEISDTYSSGDWVKVALCQRGVVVNARLANNETVAYDELLASGGDGTLVSAEDGTSPHGPDAAVARAKEAASPTGGVVRIHVEVL